MKEKIFIGADHAGFEYKEELRKELFNKGYLVIDVGALKYNKEDDYPDVAYKLAKNVAKDKNSKGILICGTGAGMVIAANKIKGIRAVEIYDEYSAKLTREHNDANIAAFGSRNNSIKNIKKLLNIWLNTNFSNEKRHKRRLNKIAKY